MMRKRYWLGIVVSGLLVVLMLRAVDPAAIGQVLKAANFIFLLPALVFYLGGVVARTARWAILMKPVARLSFKRLFTIIVIGFMANDLLPFRAGEGVRAFLLWRNERLEPGATLGTIVVERIFDGLALTAFLLAVGLLMPLESWLTRIAWAAGVVFVVGVAATFAITLMPGTVERLAALVLRPFPARLRELGMRVLVTFVNGLGILRSGRDTAAVVLLSLVAWALEATMYFSLMFAFTMKPSFVAALLGTAVANLGTMVPSSPGYVGTFDVPLAAVMVGTFQVDPAVAAGYTFLVHAALVVPVSLLGLFVVWREGLSLTGITSAGTRVGRERDSAHSAVVASSRQPFR